MPMGDEIYCATDGYQGSYEINRTDLCSKDERKVTTSSEEPDSAQAERVWVDSRQIIALAAKRIPIAHDEIF